MSWNEVKHLKNDDCRRKRSGDRWKWAVATKLNTGIQGMGEVFSWFIKI